jgi:uncharacterized protein YndB with AHSA1/START domain
MSANTAVASKPSVTLQRRLNVPPAKVYAAWTRPEMIVQWFGPNDAQQGSVKAEMDVRTGGKFTISFTHGNGELSKVSGIYKDVVPNERLVFSWAWYTTAERVSQVTVTTKADGDGTLLTLKHEQFFDQAACDGHTRGWTGTLEKLAAYLEQ